MSLRVAVVQDHPVFFNKKETLKKVGDLVASCAAQGSQLVLFPESFIPGYPRDFDFGTRIGDRSESGRDLYLEYYRESIDPEGEDIPLLENLAAKNNCYLVIGVTEQNTANNSLYCSMLYISPTSGLLGIHRKIKPTGQERVIWAEADGESLCTFATPVGKIGGLICWENYMPLARMALYSKGVEIYLAPTADARPGWIASMQHIALEGRCYVLGCNQYIRRSDYPESYRPLLKNSRETRCPGGSVIVSPVGEILAGPLQDEAGILFADLDLSEIVRSKLDFDVNGHYQRKDIFAFEVHGQPPIKKEAPAKEAKK
ncbi:MAG: carbon-nitrogen hydrolase family protein [Robiginitalea sp.]